MDQSTAYIYILIMIAVLAPIAATLWVAGDVHAMRRYELHVCGESDCNPFRWALAVVLLPIVAIPLYLRFRREKMSLHAELTSQGS